MKVLTPKKYPDHIPCSFAYKLFCVDDKFTKPIVVFRGANAAYEFIKAILKEYQYCKGVAKKHFNKNLIMSQEEVTRAGYVQISLMMMTKKLRIIVT